MPPGPAKKHRRRLGAAVLADVLRPNYPEHRVLRPARGLARNCAGASCPRISLVHGPILAGIT